MRPLLSAKTGSVYVPTDFGIEVWSRTGYERTLRLPDSQLRLTCLELSKDGNCVLAGTDAGKILHWNLSSNAAATEIVNTTLIEHMPVKAIRAICMGNDLRGFALLHEAVVALDLAAGSMQRVASTDLPPGAASIACSGCLQTLAVASACEIKVFSVVAHFSEIHLAHIASCVGHVQMPTAMRFLDPQTLVSSDAQIPVVLLWKFTAREQSDTEAVELQYCDTCQTFDATVSRLTGSAERLLCLHTDGSATVVTIKEDGKTIQPCHTFPANEGEAVCANASEEGEHRIAYIMANKNIRFGAVYVNDTGSWIMQLDKDVSMNREEQNKLQAKAQTAENFASAMPVFRQAEDEPGSAVVARGAVPIQLHQALNTGDGAAFEQFMFALEPELTQRTVAGVSKRHAEKMLELLAATLQSPTVNAAQIGHALRWLTATVQAHKDHLRSLSAARRAMLLAPLRAVCGDYERLEDTLRSFSARMGCLNGIRTRYVEAEQRSKKTSKRMVHLHL